MPDQRRDTPQIRALALLGEQFDMAIERVEAAEAAPRERRGISVLVPRRRVARAALATAFACLIGLLVYALAIDTGTTPSPEEALADVAEVARLQPMPDEDQYFYTRALVTNRLQPVEPLGSGREEEPPGPPVLVTSDRRSWVSISRPGLVIDRAISVRPADPDGEVDPELRESTLGAPTTFEHPRLARYKFGDRSYTRAEIVAVPTDPQAIVDLLREGLPAGDGERRAADLWRAITQTLTRATAPLPPELRAGLIDSLALVPGVTVEDDDVAVRGSAGRAFTLDADGVKQTIVFDIETADTLLSETTVSSRDAARAFEQPVGSLLDRWELVENAIVDELPAGERSLSEE